MQCNEPASFHAVVESAELDYLLKGDGNAAQIPANLQRMQVSQFRMPTQACICFTKDADSSHHDVTLTMSPTEPHVNLLT